MLASLQSVCMKAATHNPQPLSSKHLSGVSEDIGLAPVQFLMALVSGLLWVVMCALAALTGGAAHAQALVPSSTDGMAPLQAQVESLLRQQTVSGETPSGVASQSPHRVEILLGQLDPRLRLAPCDKVHAYMPDGVLFWGKTRVGLRCEQCPVRWNVTWPVTVKVWAQALVASVPLRPGMTIREGDVVMSEVDIAASSSPVVFKQAEVVGRSLLRHIEAGQSLHQDDIRARRWFAAGDQVQLKVSGAGFTVASQGMALTAGDEGNCARVRIDSGRVVCAQPVGERMAELSW